MRRALAVLVGLDELRRWWGAVRCWATRGRRAPDDVSALYGPLPPPRIER